MRPTPLGCFMADTIVETGRLRLRRFREGDLNWWLQVMNTEQVRAHLGGIETPELAAARFARQRDSWTDEAGGWLAIERKDDGEFIGNCGFGPITSAHAPGPLFGETDIGWQLRADCWGQGFALEAGRAIGDLAFAHSGNERIFAQTSQANTRSWGLMTRLGMRRRPELDYADPDYPPEENPTIVYQVSSGEWAAAQSGGQA